MCIVACKPHGLDQHDTPQCESRGFPDQRELCICIPFHPQSALPSSSAMSCSSRWWQPPESCHPVSISRCSEEAGPVQAGWCRGSAGSAPPRASRYSSRGCCGTRGVAGLPPEARASAALSSLHLHLPPSPSLTLRSPPSPPAASLHAASHVFSLVPQLLVLLLITFWGREALHQRRQCSG